MTSKLLKCARFNSLAKTLKPHKHATFSSIHTISKYRFTEQRQSTGTQSISETNMAHLNDRTFCRDLFNDIPTELKQLPDDIYETICNTQEKSGFIPTIFLILSRRPEEFRAFFAYYDALLKSQNSKLTNFEKEAIVVATSSYNKCLYCVVAHGAMLRVFAKKEQNMSDYNTIADQIAIDYQKANLSSKQIKMLDFAVQLATEPYTVTQQDIDALNELGFGKEEIWDIGAITSFFAASNRMAHLTGLMPNAEFYEIGRLKK